MDALRDDATLTIRIAGDGGEEILLAGELCAAMLSRVPALVFLHKCPTRSLGAPASVQLRVSDQPILSPGDSLDVLFAWTQDAYDRYRDCLFSEGLLLYDTDRVRPRESDAPIRNGLPLTRLAGEFCVEHAKAYLAAGVLARLLQIPESAVAPVLAGVPEAGRHAFTEGQDRARRPPLGVLHYELSPWRGGARTPTTGEDAVAGALAAAGVRLAACAEGACESSLGAALARAGVQLHSCCDAGAALAAVQAVGGPSVLITRLGLHGLGELARTLRGTSTVLLRVPADDGACEAQDLEAILAAGTPMVFAPASVAECGAVASQAVAAAIASGEPVAFYLDPVLGDSLCSVDVGEGEALMRLDAAEARVAARAAAAGRQERVGVVAWGAMEGAVREALLTLAERGIAVAHLHLRVLAPLDEARCRAFLAPLTRVVVADPEPSGPVAAVLQQHFHVEPERIYWPAGAPLTPAVVVDAILGG